MEEYVLTSGGPFIQQEYTCNRHQTKELGSTLNFEDNGREGDNIVVNIKLSRNSERIVE